MTSWTERRKNIISKILRTVEYADKHDTKIIKEKLIAIVCMDYGSSRRKALEYINVLIGMNKIKETWDREGTYLELVKIVNELEL